MHEVNTSSLLTISLLKMIAFQETGEFYTGPSAIHEIKNYQSSGNGKYEDTKEAKFKAFILSDVDGKELLKNASVLHRVSMDNIYAYKRVVTGY